MPSILNATTTNGLVTSADNSGSLQLQTNNGTTAVTIDTSQNVGVGTTSPAARLDVLGQAMFQGSTLSSQKGALVGAVNINNNSADGVVDFTQGIVFTDNVNNSGAWTHAGITATGGSGFNGNLVFGTDGDSTKNTTGITERMRITSGGDLLVGVTSGNGKVRIKQSADSHNNTLVIENFGNTNTWSFLVGSDNNLYLGYNGTSRGNFNNSTGAYTSTSDLRLKKNIETISHGLESVLALNPVSYNFKDETDESQQHLGFIAQEAQDILPSSVSAFADGTLGMDKQEIIPVLVKAIQELKAELDATKAEVQALKGAQ